MNKKRNKSKREHLSRTNIEERATHFLDYVIPNHGDSVSQPDLKRVVDVLKSRYKVNFDFTKILGTIPDGEILGAFSVNPLTIRVSSNLPIWSPRFCRTLAHELGHLVLHRKLIGNGKYISREKPLEDTAKQLRYREMADLSDLGWVEWQANEFSMCLILPRRFLQQLVCAMQIKLGIHRNIGTIYLDDQPDNKRNCGLIVEAIAEATSAEEDLLWRRLRFLGILEDHSKKRSRVAFEILDSLFEVNVK